jgi:hypothetical protein
MGLFFIGLFVCFLPMTTSFAGASILGIQFTGVDPVYNRSDLFNISAGNTVGIGSATFRPDTLSLETQNFLRFISICQGRQP